MKSIVCFGEVLWDMLPTGKKPGGAPLNVALRAQSFGNNVSVISAVGKDKMGDEILEVLKAHSANPDHIQLSNRFETSEVLVHLNDKGSASYEIKMPCAWDDIQFVAKDAELVKNSDAFLFGSLVARSKRSSETLFSLLGYSNFNVFDVNLRPPHYTLETLVRLMEHADFIKFNDDEIFEISASMGHNSSSLEECVVFIADSTKTGQICVTRGDKGAVLFIENEFVSSSGYRVAVADTVGAGDSFLATLISKLLNGTSPGEAVSYACAVGALVASKNGANPTVSDEEIATLLSVKPE